MLSNLTLCNIVKNAMTAKEHYSTHLAHFYSWMIGDFDERQTAQQEYFVAKEIATGNNNVAIDLGAGHGLQSISLAKLGFKVFAVDFNKQLLDDLKDRANDLPIVPVLDDITKFLLSFHQLASLIVCMGDTLTHLETISDVEELVQNISKYLVQGGKIVFSFRELNVELKAEERFIPVRSDEKRILTSFLEYFPDHVMVHDILHEYDSGRWIQKVSCYPKLRLTENIIIKMMNCYQLKILSTERIRGMFHVIGEKIS